MRRYDWPGNVRQLQNVVRNIVVLHNQEIVEKSCLPPPLDAALEELNMTQGMGQKQVEVTIPDNEASIRPLAVVEREVIELAISQCGGKIPKAATLLEVSPSTIYRKKQAWDKSEVAR